MEVKKINVQRPRVALLIQNWFPVHGDAQVSMRHLSSALLEKGYEVDILTGFQKGPLSREEQAFEKLEGLRVKRYKWLYFFRAFFQLLRKKEQYEVMHAHSTSTAIIMKLASWINRLPCLFTLHHSKAMAKSFHLKKWLHKVIHQETHYSRLISTAESFSKLKNVNAPLAIIPYGVHLEPFMELQKNKEAERFVALYIGPLNHEKGLDLLLHAAAKLVHSNAFIQSHKDFLLHIAGEGFQERALKKLAEKLDIKKYVRFYGKVNEEQKMALYAASDLFVLPARSDLLPLPLLEACAAGLPILATNVGGHSMVVQENVNGHLVPEGNVDELAYYLEHFAINPQLEQMGQASRQLIEDHYTWEEHNQKYIRVYEGLEAVEKEEVFMPWKVPSLMLQSRRFNAIYKGRKPLRFCMTVNIEQSYSPSELPHEVEHIPSFLERFTEFCAQLEMPSTFFVQSSLMEPFQEEIESLRAGGHELGVQPEKTASKLPEKRKQLRNLKKELEGKSMEEVLMFRTHRSIGERELNAIHQNGFEHLPVTEDPQPEIFWRFGVPFARTVRMDLKHVLRMSDEELLASVNRLRAYQKENGIDPYLIFECSSWEFQSRDHVDYAGGENFTALAKKIAFLREHMDIEFLTLSSFCKTCSKTT